MGIKHSKDQRFNSGRRLAIRFSKNVVIGNSLVVQWLGLGAFTAKWALVRELRSHKPRGAAKKKKKKCNGSRDEFRARSS